MLGHDDYDGSIILDCGRSLKNRERLLLILILEKFGAGKERWVAGLQTAPPAKCRGWK